MSTVTRDQQSASPGDETERPPRREVSLADRYEKRSGLVYLSGLQALVRLPLDQARADREAGKRTGTLISGYEGSPLGGLDLEIGRRQKLMDEHGVVFRPAVNEELGSNAVQGSQLSSVVGEQTCDGVVGIWYGKAPGLDRSTDAMRHGNLGGAAPTGGVLALVGDDSTAKSSTVPSSSEMAMAEVGLTVLSPSDAQDVLVLGRHGIALSRFCGLWTGLKLATNVVDGAMTVDLDATAVTPVIPDNTIDGKPYRHTVSASFLQPHLAALEESLMNARPELALRYARANGLNKIVGDRSARIGFVAHGATYLDTLRALSRLGIEADSPDSGVRVLKLGMVSPLEPTIVQEFAEGLDEIIVIEEKRPFVELLVKDVLYGRPEAPAVYGKRGPSGEALVRATGDLPPEVIAKAISPRVEAVSPGLVQVDPATQHRRPPSLPLVPLLPRLPYFCSGCPHNTSTQVPEGSMVGGGIGCSALASYMDADRVGQMLGLCQMGGEGAAWTGLSPFVRENHIFQNLGDGTFTHSGSLAVRAAIASGVNITYKLLYNGAVAMTGGQQAVGGMSVPEIVQELLAEGAAKIVITTEDLDDYRGVKLPAGVEVRDRSRLIETQNELAAVPGVTVLIHDQECATELRRKRKRGKVAAPTTRVLINERVCEGCGDCGTKSNCLSVQPVETEFGRKTRIHQASCNVDYSCVQGDCPSFVMVEPGTKRAAKTPPLLEATDLPAPQLKTRVDDFGMRMTGVGGTGIVTTAQVIATAGVIDGLHVRGLDQLGLAQKGGAVVSDLIFTDSPERRPNKVGEAECDLYLGCDLLVAASDSNLATVSPERTIAVLSTSEVPTGQMVTHTNVGFPPQDRTVGVIARAARETVSTDARDLCLTLFGDDQYANVLLVGVAVQAGALPLSPDAVEEAITLNGAAVERNLQAFRRGRQVVADPAGLEATLTALASAAAPLDVPVASEQARGIAGQVRGGETLRALVERRVDELIAYQDVAYAQRYVETVEEVRGKAERAGVTSTVAEAVAANLFKLMAYKDEYEVARLVLDPAMEQAVTAEFGDDATWSVMLHPPMLRAMGMDRKIKFGPSTRPAFYALRTMRKLRGTKLDPFGAAKVRRVERELVGEYVDGVRQAVSTLSPATEAAVVELALLPDMIRGYEQIKLDNVARYRERRAEILASLREG